MAPKKKGGKKQVDDWENDLGETIDPIKQASDDAKAAEAEVNADDDLEAGGLLAALRKNKSKRAKKGKVDNDFVDGEDPTQADSPAPEVDLSSKAPEEATFDDDDVFAGNARKPKGGKKQAERPAAEPADEDDDGEGGGLKSKKEKEKEKKEREKARKKEQVLSPGTLCLMSYTDIRIGCKEEV
jgi:translation initiation factor 5B